MKKIVGSISAVVILVFFLSSCKLNNENTNPETGFFLIAQTSPDAPHLTININGSVFDTGLAFGNYTPYVSAAAGTYNFTIFPSGSSTPVITNNLNLAVNKVYSYFVVDSFHEAKAAIVEDVVVAPAGDSIHVRFFHFSPNVTQPIDIIDTTHGNAVLFSGRTFNDQSVNPSFANFTGLLAGNYGLQIKQIDGTVIARVGLNLEGGKVYTLFAKGFLGGTGDQSLGIGPLINYPQQ